MDRDGEGRALSMAVDSRIQNHGGTGTAAATTPAASIHHNPNSSNLSGTNNTGLHNHHHPGSPGTHNLTATSPTGNTAAQGTTSRGPANEPTPPRRISSEDEDPARPRKRPATLASVQQIELLNAEHMANSIGFHNPEGTHQQMGLSIGGGASPPPQPPQSPSQLQPQQQQQQQPQQQEIRKEDVDMLSPSTVDVDGASELQQTNNMPTDTATIVSSRPLLDGEEGSNGVTGHGDDEERENSSIGGDSQAINGDNSDSNTTSANYTTSVAKPPQLPHTPPSEAGASVSGDSDRAYKNSPEVEELELEDMEEDDDALAVQVMDDFISFPIRCESEEDAEDMFYRLQNCLDTDNSPLNALFELERCVLCLVESINFKEMYLMGKPAWDRVPKIVGAFLERSEPFSEMEFTREDTIYPGGNGLRLTMKLFDAFLKLTARLMRLDLELLTSRSPNIPIRTLSQEYQSISAALFKNVCPLFKSIADTFRVNVLSCQVDAVKTFVGETCNGLALSRQLAETLSDLIPEYPQLLSYYVVVNELPSQILVLLRNFTLKETIDLTTEIVDTRGHELKQVVSQDSLAMLTISFEMLRTVLEKNVALSKYALNAAIESTSALAFAFYNFEPMIGINEYKELTGVALSDLMTDQAPLFIKWWTKLDLHSRGIRNCKKIELRLNCLTAFCDELLTAWNVCHMAAEHPILKRLAFYVQDSCVIEYLFGPQSHFQLVQKSSNVVGYLIVMKLFNDYYRGIIWKPLIENRDKRFVHATIMVLKELVNNMPPNHLLDNCKIMKTLPLSAWDAPLLDYLESLLSNFSGRPFPEQHSSQMKIDLVVFELLIHLVHESFLANCEKSLASTMNPGVIWEFVFKQLKIMAQYGPTPEERRSIFSNCISEMRNNSSLSSSCVWVINAFVQVGQRRSIPSNLILPNGKGELGMLLEEMDLLRLVIQGIEHCITSEDRPEKTMLRLNPYYELLFMIVVHFPQAISSELGAELWSCLFAEKSRHALVRQNSFEFLSSTMHHTAGNEFLDTCFRVYFGQLDPSFFVGSSLDYVIKAMDCFKRKNNGVPMIAENVVQFEGIDQVWRIILTAPHDHLALRATNYFVSTYLDNPQIVHQSSDVIRATHTSIIRDCIEQLTAAASELKNLGVDNVQDGSSNKVRVELQFKRSLAVLTEFLKGHRSRPKYAAASSPSQKNHEIVQKGNMIKLRVRANGDGHLPPQQDITVGDGISGSDFYNYLSNFTGLKEFRIFTMGKEFHLKNETKELNTLGLQEGLVIQLMKRPSSPESVTSASAKEGITFAESETLTHFDELYDLLTLPEKYSSVIWSLLRQFPPQERVCDRIIGHDGGFEVVLPQNYPLQVLYSLYSIKHMLSNEAVRAANPSLPARVVNWLTRFLTVAKLHGPTTLQLNQLCDLLECLNIALSSTESLAEPLSFAAENGRLVNKLLRMLDEVGQPDVTRLNAAIPLIIRSFETLLAACQCHPSIWSSLKSHDHFKMVIERYLLHDPRLAIRQNFRKNIMKFCEVVQQQQASENDMVCDDNDESSVISRSVDYLVVFWRLLHELLPSSFRTQHTSLELFETAHSLFHRLSDASWLGMDLVSLAEEWSNILVSPPVERKVVGGVVIHGYATLLISCAKVLQATGHSLEPYKGLPKALHEAYLFPPLKNVDDEEFIPLSQDNLPLLDEDARAKLYELTLLFLDDDASIEEMVIQEAKLLEEVCDDYSISFNIDRSRWLRSTADHVGLRNQSNTCYLNSLLTQLFMNVEFRNFVLSLHLRSPGAQKLLWHAKELFAHMQVSIEKAFEPRDFTQEIKDYENQPIDISVQMDVDEFYNLLFDRLEGQMQSMEERNGFRKFYGGKLVQQVKSKECEHVSELEEPFSAIQCDIKGKQTLQESLRAYVEGESMDGDNKYSCTSCGRHVDAVKRTCLKHVPDHLIFHLKRFEFDLRTMQRSKINDFFEFPYELDVKPYTIEALSDPKDGKHDLSPDVFDLVGVLVHSGTAESGHYYSYIKDRQRSPNQSDSCWYEFNDSEVSHFDPSTIPSTCYGGGDIHTSKDMMSPIPIPKSYSAYMLFYERRESLQKTSSSPVMNKVPEDWLSKIFQQNELVVRRFCLFDPRHLNFTLELERRRLLLQKDHRCPTEDHEDGQQSLLLTFETLFMVACRIKDCNEVENYYNYLADLFESCPQCAWSFLRWLLKRPEALRTVLLRNPVSKNRKGFSNLLLKAYTKLVNGGQALEIGCSSEWTDFANDYLANMITTFTGFFEIMYMNLRSWDDYFELLCGLANVSHYEAHEFLKASYLRKCIELLLIEFVPRSTRIDYGNLWRLVDKGRKPPYHKMMDFINILLQHTDLCAPVVEEEENKESSDTMSAMEEDARPLPLSTTEQDYLKSNTKKNGNIFLYKPLDQNYNVEASMAIVKYIVQQEPTWLPITTVLRTLYNGVCVDPAHLAEAFLKALVAVVEGSKNPSDVAQIIKKVSHEVNTIDNNGGREHLNFFDDLLRVKDNPHVTPEFIHGKVLDTMQEWAPVLLTYWEHSVREAAEAFVTEHLLTPPPDDEDEAAKLVRLNRINSLVVKAFEWIEDHFLKRKASRVDQKRFINMGRVFDAALLHLKMTEQIELLEIKLNDLQIMLEKVVSEEEPFAEDWANSDNDLDSGSPDMALLDDDYNST